MISEVSVSTDATSSRMSKLVIATAGASDGTTPSDVVDTGCESDQAVELASQHRRRCHSCTECGFGQQKVEALRWVVEHSLTLDAARDQVLQSLKARVLVESIARAYSGV